MLSWRSLLLIFFFINVFILSFVPKFLGILTFLRIVSAIFAKWLQRKANIFHDTKTYDRYENHKEKYLRYLIWIFTSCLCSIVSIHNVKGMKRLAMWSSYVKDSKFINDNRVLDTLSEQYEWGNGPDLLMH